MTYFLLISLLIVAVLLVLVILLQKGRGGGLGAAFGAGAGSAFGTKTGDVLTWVTIALTVLFLGLTLFSVVAIKPEKTQVLTPEFKPETPISARALVTITCPTPKATIYFTTDNSEPTIKSPVYGTAFNVRPGQTLKAIAMVTGMNPSKVKTYTYMTPEEAAKLEAEKAKKAAEDKLKAAATMPAAPVPAKALPAPVKK